MGGPHGKVIIGTQIDTAGVKKGMKAIENSMKSLSKRALKILGIGTVTTIVKSALEAASSLQEAANVVEMSFRDVDRTTGEVVTDLTGLMYTFAEAAIESFGLSRVQAESTASSFMAMGKAMKLGMENAANMSINLTALSSDMASFYNVSNEEAIKALEAVYTGETETIKRYGIILNETNLAEFAQSKGITKSISAMTQREKVMLRYQFILERLQDVEGDFQRTQSNWKNQTRILKNQWTEFITVLGDGLINVFTPLLEFLNDAVMKLTMYAQAFAEVLGFSRQVTDTETKIGESVESTTEAIENQTKATRKGVAGFDKLNNLTTSKSGNGTDTTQDVMKLFGQVGLLESVRNAIDGAKTSIVELDETVIEKVKSIVETFKGFKELVVSFFTDLFSGDFYSAGRDISNLAVALTSFITEAIKNVDWNAVGNSIGLFLAGIEWTKVFSRLGDLVGNAIQAVFNIWSGSFNVAPFETAIITAFGLLKFTGLGSVLLKSLSKAILGGISTGLGDIWTGIQLLFKGGALGEVLEATFMGPLGIISGIVTAVTGLITFVTNLVDMFKEGIEPIEAIKTALGGVTSALGTFLIMLGAGLSVGTAGIGALIALGVTAVAELVAVIYNNWDSISEWFLNVVSWISENVIEPIKDFFSPLFDYVSEIVNKFWTFLSDGFTAVINGIKSFFEPITEWWSKLFESYGQTVSEMFYNLKVIFEGIGQILSEIFDRITVKLSNFFDKFKSIFTTIFETIREFFGKVKELFKNMWASIKQTFGNLATYFKDIFSKAWKAVCDVFSPFGDIFVKIKDGILDAFKAIVNGLIDGINAVVALPFKGINNALGKIRDINILGITPFTDLKDISIPQIPKLATGAVIPPNREFMAVLGDQKHGTNIEAPLDTIKQALAEVLGQQNVNVTFQVEGDPNGLFNVVRKEAYNYNRRTGKLAF